MKQKARWIQTVLDHYFPDPKPPLRHVDPYTLLIAVVLSARNTDVKVNQVTPHLFKLASTPEEMVLLTPEEIRSVIKSCGLSKTKAKNIWKLSEILIQRYQSQVPKSFRSLESLPGVGHKTASVVMAQVFRVPAFPVDTHILRCAQRWELSKGKTPQKVEHDLKKLFPKKDWIKLHLQIIYFARRFCPARGKHHNCPICHPKERPKD